MYMPSTMHATRSTGCVVFESNRSRYLGVGFCPNSCLGVTIRSRPRYVGYSEDRGISISRCVLLPSTCSVVTVWPTVRRDGLPIEGNSCCTYIITATSPREDDPILTVIERSVAVVASTQPIRGAQQHRGGGDGGL